MRIIDRIKSLFPLSFKNNFHTRMMLLHFFLHKNEITDLALGELVYSHSYEILKKKYGKLLDSLKYDWPLDLKTPKIIWWCWLQGEEKAPPICKACLDSLRRNMPDFEVKVITSDNMFDYVEPPQFIIEKHDKGIIDNTKFANIVRTLLLIKYGGVWIDSTVYCTGYHFPVFDNPLFMFQHWKYNIHQACVASNWLMASCKGHPVMLAMRDLLYAYWTDYDKCIDYLFYYFFLRMVADKYSSEWKKMPLYSNIPASIFQFELLNPYDHHRFEQIKGMSDFHKLKWKFNIKEKDVEGTFYDYLCHQKEM